MSEELLSPRKKPVPGLAKSPRNSLMFSKNAKGPMAAAVEAKMPPAPPSYSAQKSDGSIKNALASETTTDDVAVCFKSCSCVDILPSVYQNR
jgi:hypothetical protein